MKTATLRETSMYSSMKHKENTHRCNTATQTANASKSKRPRPTLVSDATPIATLQEMESPSPVPQNPALLLQLRHFFIKISGNLKIMSQREVDETIRKQHDDASE